MYNEGSAEFNELIDKSGGNAPTTRFTFTDFAIEHFTKLEYYGGSNNSDDIAIGTTNMAYLDVSAITDKIITNQEFLLEVGMELSDGTMEYAPMGYFTVQKPDGNEDTVDFTAYDRMHKFEKPYVSSLAYPTDSEKVLNELCTMCGVELATPITSPIAITDKLDGYTCREVLGYIAGIHGFFACFDRYGKLNLRWYSETPIEKQIGLIWSLTKSQSNYTVEKITLAKDTETTYTSGTGISGINYSNPYATQAIADSIYANLGGFSYRPCEISMLDDIRLDPWDMLKVTYLDGSVLTIPVMSLEHSFTSGETRVKSFGKTDTENEYSYAGPTTQAMDRMATELLVANRIIATKVDAEWVNAHTVTATELEATNARVSTLETNSLTAETADLRYADITLANIDTANIDVANIGLLFTKVGLIDRATIVDGHITGFLDAVEVNANNITAGTLIADRILLKGSESGLLYALNNLGELTSTEVNTLDGTILTQRTVTADKLVANSITANELDVTNIFGNSAVLSTLTSQQAFINAISTNSVVVGASKTANDANAKAQGIIDNIYTKNTTTIDGGKITTGSITADKINATSLSAITANLGTVTAGQITVSSTAWIPPIYSDIVKLTNFINGTATPTAAQKTAFDFDSSGTLDLNDFAYLKAYLLNGKALPSTYTKTTSAIKVNIQPAVPDKCIEITGTNSYGSAIDVYFGLTETNVIKLTASSVQTGYLSVTDETDISGTLSVTGATTLNSTLNVTGATQLTGTLIESQGSYVHSSGAGAGSNGYIHLATLKITGAYQNAPIVIELSKRGQYATCTIYIEFSNSSGTDPELAYFRFTGANYGCYLSKSATSTWKLYVSKSEAYDYIGVVRYHKPAYMSGVTITWEDTYASGLGSSYYTAMLLANSYLPLSGGTMTGQITSANVVPSATNTYSCGTASNHWLEVCASNIRAKGSDAGNYGTLWVGAVGTTSTAGYGVLTIGNNIASGTAGNGYGKLRLYNTSTGYIDVQCATGTTSSYIITLPATNGTVTVSDIRAKEDVSSLSDIEDIRSMYMKFRPVRYRYKKDMCEMHYDNKWCFGFIAQEVNEILPEKDYAILDVTEKYACRAGYFDNILGLDKEEMVALNTYMIQNHENDIEIVKKQLEKALKEIQTLKRKLSNGN